MQVEQEVQCFVSYIELPHETFLSLSAQRPVPPDAVASFCPPRNFDFLLSPSLLSTSLFFHPHILFAFPPKVYILACIFLRLLGKKNLQLGHHHLEKVPECKFCSADDFSLNEVDYHHHHHPSICRPGFHSFSHLWFIHSHHTNDLAVCSPSVTVASFPILQPTSFQCWP